MYAIKQHSPGLWILEENGENVLLKDCVRFGLRKVERVWLFQTLQDVVAEIQRGMPVEGFVEMGVLKQLGKQKETEKFDLWEVRDPGRAGRIIFVREGRDSIVIAAVDKGRASQSQAIRRGVKRWKDYLKDRGR